MYSLDILSYLTAEESETSTSEFDRLAGRMKPLGFFLDISTGSEGMPNLDAFFLAVLDYASGFFSRVVQKTSQHVSC